MGQNINQNLINQATVIKEINYSELLDGVHCNDLISVSKALTIVENKNFEFSNDLLEFLSKLKEGKRTLRIGISGPPGVGKSTFIETLGLKLVEQGKKLAILAVDPTSEINKGSILGDKTRMEALSKLENVLIRPSANALQNGGVRNSTYDGIKVCEAAGYDIILVETVGVGQSEVAVTKMTDLMILLLPPAGGDELQGIKKGILEIADIVLINKTDSGLEKYAASAFNDHKLALHYSPRRNDILKDLIIRKISALQGLGIDETASDILTVINDDKIYHKITNKRLKQEKDWLNIKAETLLMHLIKQSSGYEEQMENANKGGRLYNSLLSLKREFEKKLK